MKRLLTLLAALIGFSSNSYANCFDEVESRKTGSDQQFEEARAFCFVSDLRQLNELKLKYDEATTEEKYQLIKRYDEIFDRLMDNGYGDVVAASSIYCAVCSGER